MQPNPYEPPSDEVLLHQYETIVGLYKHHLDLILKANIFIYAVTGAILSFYFSKPNDGIIKYSLIFPSVMNLGYSYFFFDSSRKIKPFDDDIRAIVNRFRLISLPDTMVLKKFLQLSACLFLATSIGLLLLTLLR